MIAADAAPATAHHRHAVGLDSSIVANWNYTLIWARPLMLPKSYVNDGTIHRSVNHTMTSCKLTLSAINSTDIPRRRRPVLGHCDHSIVRWLFVDWRRSHDGRLTMESIDSIWRDSCRLAGWLAVPKQAGLAGCSHSSAAATQCVWM